MKVTEQQITTHVEALQHIGNLGPNITDGFLRAGWSGEETAAIEYIRSYGEQQGLVGRYDEIGNFYLRTPDNAPYVAQVGSHLDTVPRGGLYDGGAGIIAGLEAILAVFKHAPLTHTGLELVIWRCEESATFGALFAGSNAAFGKLPPTFLSNKFQGRTLQEAIRSQGFDPSIIERHIPTISQNYIDGIRAHIELHIEQATKLEKDEIDIGIVTSIRGAKRFRIVIHGEAGHSGTTPMGIRYRKDANLAMSHMHVALDKLANDTLEKGNDFVQTVGIINSDITFNEKCPSIYENSITRISPLSYFSLDIRSNKSSFLETYAAEALELISNIAKDFGCTVEITPLASPLPLEAMDASLQDLFETHAKKLGYSSIRMPSGAGHDVGIVSRQKKSDGTCIPTALLFIPCKNGLSHNPLEFASHEAIAKGATLIANVLLGFCERPEKN